MMPLLTLGYALNPDGSMNDILIVITKNIRTKQNPESHYRDRWRSKIIKLKVT